MRNREYLIKLPYGRVLCHNKRLFRPHETLPLKTIPTEDEAMAALEVRCVLRNRDTIKPPKCLIEEI